MSHATQPSPPEPRSDPASRPRPSEGEEIVVRLPSVSRLLRTFLPHETVTHLRNAQREQMLAMRSLLDASIQRLDEDEARDASRRGPATPHRVQIQVE